MLRFAWKTMALRGARTRSPQEVEAIARRRLRRLVGYAVERSPFYRERFRRIDLDTFRLEDLPTTTKSELMADFDGLITDPEVSRSGLERFMEDPANADRLYLDRYVASHTSGSQGQPLLILQEPRHLELAFGMQMTRGNARKASWTEAIRRFVQPARLAAVTLKRGFYPSATMFQHMPRTVRHFIDFRWFSQTDEDVVARLNEFRPQILTAYSGVLEMLALEAEAGRLRLAPELHQVVNNSELLTDRARERIERAFGQRVLDNYATGECPFLSNGCPAGRGSHVNADWAILEVVDERGRAVPAGTAGAKVLVTNLANTIQPFIRYEVPDVVTMATEPCGCGSLLPRIAKIDGRTADAFWVGEGRTRRRLIAMILAHAFEYCREMREWQAIQVAPSRLRVRLEPLPGARVDAERVRGHFKHALALHEFPDVDVDVEIVPHLEADAGTGKFRRMVSLLRTSADGREIRVEPPTPVAT